MEKNFTDIKFYNTNMAKPMDDKLFFLDKIDWENNVIVDFGCADGRILAEIKRRIEGKNKKNFFYIGYDISPVMIDFAKTNWDGDGGRVFFTSNWEDVIMAIEARKSMTGVLLLSSVIHEVYSYAKDENEINEFWDRVLNTGFRYVIVRDMMVDHSVDKSSNYNIYSALKEKKLYDNGMYQYAPYVTKFERHWGSVERNKNAIHFLLKYPWLINWEREVNENYLPIYTTDLVEKMFKRYDIEYFKHYKLPFIVDRIKKDWGFILKDNTHVKAIFKLRK